MTNALEDKIIAYFEGELSDADSAELLHRVSVSPEIRTLFREHEMLREMAKGAMRSATISPEIESSIFSRIEAMAPNALRQRPMLVFSRRIAAVAALALILISGSLGYFVPKLLSDNSQEISNPVLLKPENIRQSAATSSLKDKINILIEAPAKEIPVSENKTFKTYGSDKIYNLHRSNDSPEAVEQLPSDNISGISMITPLSLKAADIRPDNSIEKHSPFDTKEFQQETSSPFEASLQTSSGFTYPADKTPIKPFADIRFSLGYHMTENNVIGFRIASGLYQQLGDVSRRNENGIEVLSRSIEAKRSFSGEAFITHLVPVYFSAPFFLEFSASGGLIPNGYSLGAEAGVRIPFSENIFFDAAFALSRIHSNAQTSEEILASENAGKPILLNGSDIHNTLNGRLHYGLLFRF
jgi:hypothetical protein